MAEYLYKSIGIDKIVQYLEHERNRFFNTGKSDKFCDSEKCLEIATTIDIAIANINKNRKEVIRYE